MKKETIKKRVADNIPGAEYYSECEDQVWYLIDIVTSKRLGWARLPYVQLLPYSSNRLLMIVCEKY